MRTPPLLCVPLPLLVLLLLLLTIPSAGGRKSTRAKRRKPGTTPAEAEAEWSANHAAALQVRRPCGGGGRAMLKVLPILDHSAGGRSENSALSPAAVLQEYQNRFRSAAQLSAAHRLAEAEAMYDACIPLANRPVRAQRCPTSTAAACHCTAC